jgi:hypothetical protein
MVDAAQLVRGGKIDAPAVDRLTDAAAIAEALAKAGEAMPQAALAIAAGKTRAAAARSTLVGLLAKDGAPGRAAAWALAQLGAEAELLEAATGKELDRRENGYWGLAALAARHAASAPLAAALAKQVDVEIEKARSGGTGLGEHACRILAILGAPGTGELIQKVMENDRFCDRFELQRLRKAVQDGGRDSDSVRDFTAAWTTVFADHIAAAPTPAAAPAPATASAKLAPAPGGKLAPPPKGVPVAKPPAAKAPMAKAAVPPLMDELGDDGEGGDAGEAGAAGAPPSAAKPVDWKGFIASPEAAALAPQVKSLIAQLGPVLEQLAARAIQAPLADLTGQELAALLLQVMPQALPQQAVQAALSPQALNGYQAVMRFLARTGAATNGEELVAGVKLVRQELAAQIRQSGILGGPDYSDPDEPKVK